MNLITAYTNGLVLVLQFIWTWIWIPIAIAGIGISIGEHIAFNREYNEGKWWFR